MNTMKLERNSIVFKFVLFGIWLIVNAGLPDTAFTQVRNEGVIEPLKIGEQLSDIPISGSNLLNYSKVVSRLSDITAKKSVILDFFATWCTPCVAELPRLDSLQRAFGDNLQIVVVTHEGRDKVAAFLKSNSTAAKIRLPIITGDTVLRAFFPHKVVPHDVWLNGSTVKAITGSESITAPAIAQLIKNQLSGLAVKREDINFDASKPIFEKGNGGEPRNMFYRSTLTGYLDGLTSSRGVTPEPDNQVSRIFAVNADILDLCKHALGMTTKSFPANRIQILTADPGAVHFTGQDYERWKLKHIYTYELQGPPNSPGVLRQLMLDDLRRYLNVVPSVGWKEVEVYLLEIAQGRSDALRTLGAKPDENLYVNDNLPKYLTNQPITFLVDKLNKLSPLPVINQTQLTHNIDLRLPASLNDFPALKQHLSSCGLNLILAKRKVEVLVIKEAASLEEGAALSF
jgi:thiol-disulfide isomerase/thioredoxin